MPEKFDQDSSPGEKLLRVFRKLLLNDRKHYQSELAKELNCSPQTIIRIMNDIESVLGINLVSGSTNRRKWYRIDSGKAKMPGLNYEELRYLSVCRTLAAQTLPDEILSRVDDTIFNLSMRLAEKNLYQEIAKGNPGVTFFNKGKIDYKGFYPMLEILLQAMEKNFICKIAYKALGKKAVKEHLFLPHKLLSMNQVLYVAGATMNEEMTDSRHFMNLALHRMEGIELTKSRAYIDFPALDPNAFGLPWHEPRYCRVHFKSGKAADYIAERIWSDPQKLIWQEDGSLILEIVTCSMPELEAWARSFGDELIGIQECGESIG